MSESFSGPASSSGINWADLKGALLLFTVTKQELDVQTTFGPADPIRADVAVLDGTEAGTEYADTLVFPKALIGQLKPKIGGRVLGRLGQGQSKPGQSPPWLIGDFTDADAKIATAYLASADPPF